MLCDDHFLVPAAAFFIRIVEMRKGDATASTWDLWQRNLTATKVPDSCLKLEKKILLLISYRPFLLCLQVAQVHQHFQDNHLVPSDTKMK